MTKKNKKPSKAKPRQEKASDAEPNGDHIDGILREWRYDPASVSVRLTQGSDKREVIQMRVEMGVLQLETSGRPDGDRPAECDTYYDFLLKEEVTRGDSFELSEDQCVECDREFVQFYHRRVCWLALQHYENAVADADHTLGLMDMCRRHSPEEDWTLTHEQYRPFVMYHRIQAHAMSKIVDENAEEAIYAINAGLDSLKSVFAEHELEDHFEDDDLVARLVELREQLRDQFDVGQTLQERLDDAVAAEKYELAAQLRDELNQRNQGRR